MRNLDHLVLPVPSLVAASRFLGRLGFNVAAEGHHPFGTSNACVFFPNGTYLEPLAVRDEGLARAAANEGNVFTQRHLEQGRLGKKVGLSAFVLASDDAVADHAYFERQQLSAGSMLTFSREAKSADGNAVTATFKLAFADLRSADLFAFTCQRINSTLPGGALLEHPNGALGVAEVVLTASDSAEASGRIETFLQKEPEAQETDITFRLGNSLIRIVRETSDYSISNQDRSFGDLTALRFVIAVKSLTSIEGILTAANVSFERKADRLIVHLQPEFPTVLSFVERSDSP